MYDVEVIRDASGRIIEIVGNGPFTLRNEGGEYETWRLEVGRHTLLELTPTVRIEGAGIEVTRFVARAQNAALGKASGLTS